MDTTWQLRDRSTAAVVRLLSKGMQVGRLTCVAEVAGVGVYVHWTVFLLAVLVLVEAPRGLDTTIAGLASYLGLLLLHESGHLIAARRRGFAAVRVAIYPFFGLAYHERPEDRFDRAFIAWGGVLAQLAVAVPLVAITSVVGYGEYEPLKTVLLLWGDYSLLLVAFNLLPIPPLDGWKAWAIIPAYLERRRKTGGD